MMVWWSGEHQVSKFKGISGEVYNLLILVRSVSCKGQGRSYDGQVRFR